ncbi:bifunctional phosphoglucose/phosphomannose isomerase [bacterium]|nr:bifunctional phosphoglucose/phosphomannose isomerase [bacterium]|tara:strand:- start:8295 stop:9275 length:981 start_codon:yes stop_codon:yes gene_type:complete
MKNIVANFEAQIFEALKIVKESKFKSTDFEFKNVLICGVGGSGIAGSVVMDLVHDELKIPLVLCKGYHIPAFVNEKTLVIVSSYSGNTEETLEAFKQANALGAEIAVVSGGGKLLSLAEDKNLNCILLPDGYPPRAVFNFSVISVMAVLNKYGLISDRFYFEFEKSVKLLVDNQDKIIEEAKTIAQRLGNKIPVVYAMKGFEGVATRLRQQFNENAKTLGWSNVIPEMNHNEILGWRTNTDNLLVINLRTPNEFSRNAKRFEVSQEIYGKYTDDIFNIWSSGASQIENTMYLVNFADWLTVFVAEEKGVDAMEFDIIEFLKGRLAE